MLNSEEVKVLPNLLLIFYYLFIDQFVFQCYSSGRHQTLGLLVFQVA